MPQKLKLAVSQSRTLATLKQTLQSLEATTHQAAREGVDLILFPEAFLGGYPRSCSFGSVIGSRKEEGREQYLQYFKSAVDLGDTPIGGGDDWVDKKLPVGKGQEYRGDGTREFLERVARDTGVFVVTGLVEKAGGSLYCAVMYVCPRFGCLGKRRKVMPTGSERIVWAQGSASTLRAVTTTIRGVKITMAAAICWENLMPLLRYSLYSQNVNLWLAPTADQRPTWLPLMQTIGNEGRCFVLSSITCVKRKNLPSWVDGAPQQQSTNMVNGNTLVNGTASPASRNRRRSTITVQSENHELVLPAMDQDIATEAVVSPSAEVSTKPILPPVSDSDSAGEEFACRGGSCITSPFGVALQGPLWEVEDGGLLIQDVDFDDCERGRLDLDVAGSYQRNDAFRLTVAGLDITPPP